MELVEPLELVELVKLVELVEPVELVDGRTSKTMIVVSICNSLTCF